MSNPLDGAELLEAARTTLMDDLSPHVPDEKRYELLMANNAMGIASRELSADETTTYRMLERITDILGVDASPASNNPRETLREHDHLLAQEIRAGHFSINPKRSAVAAYLRERTLDATRISNPRFLQRRGFE